MNKFWIIWAFSPTTLVTSTGFGVATLFSTTGAASSTTGCTTGFGVVALTTTLLITGFLTTTLVCAVPATLDTIFLTALGSFVGLFCCTTTFLTVVGTAFGARTGSSANVSSGASDFAVVLFFGVELIMLPSSSASTNSFLASATVYLAPQTWHTKNSPSLMKSDSPHSSQTNFFIFFSFLIISHHCLVFYRW